MSKITIRNLDEDLYMRARIVAVEQRCSVADVLNAALEDWLVIDDDTEPVLDDQQSSYEPLGAV